MDLSGILATADGAVSIRVKVVPGASCTRIVGILGDQLKVAVVAPPEDGKANRQLCDHLARVLELPRSAVRITGGHGHPKKSVQVNGVSASQISERLASYL